MCSSIVRDWDTRCSPKGLMEIVSLSKEEVHSINKSHRNERFVSSAKLLRSTVHSRNMSSPGQRGSSAHKDVGVHTPYTPAL